MHWRRRKQKKLVFEIFLRVTLHDDFGLPVDETKSVVQVCTAELAARRIRSSESFETFQDIFSGGAMVFSKFSDLHAIL